MNLRNLPTSCATLSALLFSSSVSAFYLPGVAPTSYKASDRVDLNVNHLTPALSEKDSQLHSVFSFDYYHPAFQFCRPTDGPKDVSESLGSILFGDRILTSPFELKMMVNETCKTLCDERKFDPRGAKFVNRRIFQNYNLNWLIDGLPAGQPYTDPSTGTDFTLRGFPLGMIDKDQKAVLNNHYDIVVNYHTAGKDQYRVVGVLVIPSSRQGSVDGGSCRDPEKHLILDEDGETPVTWTYGVYWIESQTAWATRWDSYLHVFDPRIHWFSLINSAVIVVFLCGMCSCDRIRGEEMLISLFQVWLERYSCGLSGKTLRGITGLTRSTLMISQARTEMQRMVSKKILAGSLSMGMSSARLRNICYLVSSSAMVRSFL